MKRTARTLLVGPAIFLVAGCALIAGTNGYAVDPSLDDASVDSAADTLRGDSPGTEGGPVDAADAVSEAAGDAVADVSDAGADAPPEGSTNTGDAAIYTSLDAGGAVWATSDVSGIAADAVDGFNGGAFDGKYMYFAPIGGTVLRLDTTLPGEFGGTGPWTAQSLTAVAEDGGTIAAQGFSGAVYDGRYVYFVPFQTQALQQTSQVVRYDTHGAFASTASWQAFDTKTHLGAEAAGFQGGVFDSRYVYFVPNGAGGSGTFVRYDTQGTFQDPAAWLSVDLTTLVSSTSAGFAGGLYAPPYVYLVPSSSSWIARYDTTAAFDVAGSWASYDVSRGGTAPYGFLGGAVAGNDVLLAPSYNDVTFKFFGTVYEYDTTTPFTDSASWSSFDATALPGEPQGFFGAAFDGRWVYFAPQLSSASGTSTFSGVLARYDTTAGFAGLTSWQSFDMQTIDSNATGFAGAVFDGTYVYFIPATSSATFARFLARTAAASPPFMGSFY